MHESKGISLPITGPRRFIIDLVHFARQVPSTPVSRTINVSALFEPRSDHPSKPSWAVLFMKAYALVGAHSNPELLAIDKDVALRQARHWNPIMMNGVLFGRISRLYDQRASLKLTAEEKRLLERTFVRFRRSSVDLQRFCRCLCIRHESPCRSNRYRWPNRLRNHSSETAV